MAAHPRLRLKNLGPVKDANIAFGDLTVLTGPQASGKTLFLETFKFMLDSGPIRRKLAEAGLVWSKPTELPELVFGEGLGQLWTSRTEVALDGRPLSLEEIASSPVRGGEKCLYVPAQRALVFNREGWLRAFSDFRPNDPFVVRDFSDELRQSSDAVGDVGVDLLSQASHYGRFAKGLINTVLGNYRLLIQRDGASRRFVLAEGSQRLPFLVWSAGQREFIPLWRALLLLPIAPKKGDPRWVVIEEPEMGLHPRAIEALLFLLLDLLERKYRVVLSTHSVEVLNLVWALRRIQERGGAPDVLALFGAKSTGRADEIARSVMRKRLRAYYFEPGQPTVDLGDLQITDETAAAGEWGGLTSFASRATDVVTRLAAR